MDPYHGCVTVGDMENGAAAVATAPPPTKLRAPKDDDGGGDADARSAAATAAIVAAVGDDDGAVSYIEAHRDEVRLGLRHRDSFSVLAHRNMKADKKKGGAVASSPGGGKFLRHQDSVQRLVTKMHQSKLDEVNRAHFTAMSPPGTRDRGSSGAEDDSQLPDYRDADMHAVATGRSPRQPVSPALPNGGGSDATGGGSAGGSDRRTSLDAGTGNSSSGDEAETEGGSDGTDDEAGSDDDAADAAIARHVSRALGEAEAGLAANGTPKVGRASSPSRASGSSADTDSSPRAYEGSEGKGALLSSPGGRREDASSTSTSSSSEAEAASSAVALPAAASPTVAAPTYPVSPCNGAEKAAPKPLLRLTSAAASDSSISVRGAEEEEDDERLPSSASSSFRSAAASTMASAAASGSATPPLPSPAPATGILDSAADTRRGKAAGGAPTATASTIRTTADAEASASDDLGETSEEDEEEEEEAGEEGEGVTAPLPITKGTLASLSSPLSLAAAKGIGRLQSGPSSLDSDASGGDAVEAGGGPTRRIRNARDSVNLRVSTTSPSAAAAATATAAAMASLPPPGAIPHLLARYNSNSTLGGGAGSQASLLSLDSARSGIPDSPQPDGSYASHHASLRSPPPGYDYAASGGVGGDRYGFPMEPRRKNKIKSMAKGVGSFLGLRKSKRKRLAEEAGGLSAESPGGGVVGGSSGSEAGGSPLHGPHQGSGGGGLTASSPAAASASAGGAAFASPGGRSGSMQRLTTLFRLGSEGAGGGSPSLGGSSSSHAFSSPSAGGSAVEGGAAARGAISSLTLGPTAGGAGAVPEALLASAPLDPPPPTTRSILKGSRTAAGAAPHSAPSNGSAAFLTARGDASEVITMQRRRLTFADQHGRELNNVHFCDDLHYSANSDHSQSDDWDADVSRCALM